nr:type II toxin-antitoxin system HicB family antitoxin [Butyrivibrio sp. WCE2006]
MEDGVWLCEVEEAPSCNSRGDTPEEALRYSREYVQKYLDGYED